jgi:hypothetical protein
MRAIFFTAIVAISTSPAFAGTRCGLTSCQAIYQACLVDSKEHGWHRRKLQLPIGKEQNNAQLALQD